MSKGDQIYGDKGNKTSGGEHTIAYTDIELCCKVKHI